MTDAIGAPPTCRVNPQTGVHCFHETRREGTSTGWGSGSTEVTSVCCHCNAQVRVRFVMKRDPSHGPFAPSTLQMDE